MTTPILIALSSRAMGSGKSTVAQWLQGRHGFKIVKFATPLKSMTACFLSALGMDVNQIADYVDGPFKESEIPGFEGLTSRRFQQLLGTEFGRECIDQNVWVKIAMTRAARLMAEGHSVVIDDMRFMNEYQAVATAGGYCVRIDRPGIEITTAAHASEGALDHLEMRTIPNTGSLNDLINAVDEFLVHLERD